MLRGALTLLFLLLVSAPATAAEPPPGILTVLTGRLDVPAKTDDEFTLHVFTMWGHGIAEVLAEIRLERGSFEVKLPVPDRPYFAMVTSRNHQPVLRAFRAGRQQPRFKKPIRPQPWNRVAVTVTESDGRRARAAVIRSCFRPKALALYQWLPWLETETAADEDGVTHVPWGEDGRLSISTERARERLRDILRSVGPVRLVRRPGARPIHIKARLWPAEKRRGRVPDSTHLAVEFQVGGTWTPALPPASAGGGIPVIEGWNAMRIAYPRHRPFVLLRGDRPEVTRIECLLKAEESLRRKGSTLHVVPCGLGPPDPVYGMCGTSAPWIEAPPFRLELFDASGRRCDRGSLDGASCPGLPAGPYTLKVRGRLGRPVVRRVELPSKCAVRIPVDVTGGSGILLLVRRGSGGLEEVVSFRVTDASGTAVEVEYTDAARRGLPAFTIEDRRFTNVPNAGLIRLDPGEWKVELLDGERVERTFTVRAWPNTVTRLDTRALAAKRVKKPAKTVRLR